MHLNIFAFAIPLFLFFIGLEYLIAKKKGKNYYSFSSSVANMNVGIAERLIDLFTASSFYFFYNYLHKHYAIFDIQPSLLLWVALLLATDFLWYWYHRFGHEVNLLWGLHVVHHSSDEYNFTAGTRITILQSVARTAFWAILPIIGFPAEMITTFLLIHGTYPFFTHTQLIGKLGILEYLLVTPNHHRVHHASNECYLDKNYGDMLIIWDKIFGTYAEESEPIKYGLTKPLESKSFLWQHFHFLVEIGYAVSKTKGFVPKLKIIFGSPANFDPSIREIVERKFLTQYKIPVESTRFQKYILAQMVCILTILFVLLLFESHINIFLQTITAFVILVTLINCGAILEQRRWVYYLEFVRLFLIIIPFIVYFPQQTCISLSFIALLLLVKHKQLFASKNHYLALIYGEKQYITS